MGGRRETIRKKVREAEEETKQKATFESDYRFDAGYTKPIVTINEKDDFVKCIALHYTLLVSLSELNQFIDGLSTCNVLNLIKVDPDSFRGLFEVGHAELTAEDVDAIFDPVFSPTGSNKYAIEQSIIFNFNQYLEDAESGKVIGQLEDREVKISLSDIFQFATGARHIPAVGFSPRPTIVFLHHLHMARKISTNSCANILKFPVSGLNDGKKFSEEFTFCLLNSPGFQLV
ncbi:G2/M phase-specific E3 ubiquitin-protein ligase-like [Dendronephthya gigantea]|uniref:G2/M phase-specific E3 ubiquitin-protein ligase-like n=1 Tax=Dendronephthya gigantea TaxID=151771 RepID=UPI001069747C|nr:G2/M phase-specific E3 ubiquitin-protein ligase-like [Dendronephthya gigantea]